jgi:hypothetical protein
VELLTGIEGATSRLVRKIVLIDAILGSGADASGDLTVDNAILNGGTVAIGEDGTGDLSIESGSSGSVTAVVVASLRGLAEH